MRAIGRFATHARAALVIVAVALLGACATRPGGAARLEKVLREDPAALSGYAEVGSAEASRFVTVFRGQPVAARTPFTLQRGDEVETGPGSAAVIRFPDGGSVLLGASTRVRIGSLEVLFGNVLARVRGLFSVESENVIAGVEGTEFLFTVGTDRGVRVVVLDGVVVCRSKRGNWKPIRLGATQVFSSPHPNQGLPRVEQADPRELDDIRAWARRVGQVRLSGYCCDGGRVFPSWSNACRGLFFADQPSAERACVQPEPVGWCCDDGRVTSGPRGQCRGLFYPDQQSAVRACARPEPTGWCCDDGRVVSGPRGQCRGLFYLDQQSATRACAAPPGWCCLSGYRLEPMTNASCVANNGRFYADQRSASVACRAPVQ
ncbi:MAG TPA: FecR family protein [Burkholderiales bacterium]|nr:FecR family protein [Burkholderiales bacterium]